MKDCFKPSSVAFLSDGNENFEDFSLIKFNLYLTTSNQKIKPYQLDYNVLLLSYQLWKGKDLEEFCEKQTLSYFLFNPQNDSAEAREAMYLEIREFLLGN